MGKIISLAMVHLGGSTPTGMYPRGPDAIVGSSTMKNDKISYGISAISHIP